MPHKNYFPKKHEEEYQYKLFLPELWLNTENFDVYEIAYLILFSFLKRDGKWKKDRQMLFEVNCDENNVNQIEDDGENYGEGSTSMLLISGEYGIEFSTTFSGDYTQFFPGTYEDPPEGGDPRIDGIDIDEIYMTADGDEVPEVNTKMKITGKPFTEKHIFSMIYDIVFDEVEAEENFPKNYKKEDWISVPDKLPPELETKLKKVYTDEKVQQNPLLKRLKAKKLSKDLGLF